MGLGTYNTPAGTITTGAAANSQATRNYSSQSNNNPIF